MAIHTHMTVRGTSSGSMFHWQNSYYLIREEFLNSLWEALLLAGYLSQKYAGLSFWIEPAATTAGVVSQTY